MSRAIIDTPGLPRVANCLIYHASFVTAIRRFVPLPDGKSLVSLEQLPAVLEESCPFIWGNIVQIEPVDERFDTIEVFAAAGLNDDLHDARQK